jgi:hypothetical protein
MKRRAVPVLFLASILGILLLSLLATSRLNVRAGEPGEGPMVVDFGGAPDGALVAGLDQWLAQNSDGHFTPSANVTGAQRVMVLRVYFNDYPNASRYSSGDVGNMFSLLDTLWQNTSYSKISIDYQVSELYQLPDNRSLYIDDYSDGDLSSGDKFWKVLDDAIDNAPAGLDWTNLEAVMVVMAETGSQFHRGQATSDCNLKMGPGGAVENVGCAIFSENPTNTDLQVWGRWAHEIGHAFQQGGPAHPSNYNNEFELMDSNYPGQTGVFEKQSNTGFPGWMPSSKYVEVTPDSGGQNICLWAEEYDPTGKPNPQAIHAEITGSLYYMISVRRRVLGDELNGGYQPGSDGGYGIPDQGVLIERVSEGSDPWVTVKGLGNNRNKLWKTGDTYSGGADGIVIQVTQRPGPDDYCVQVRYDSKANQPDVMLDPWTSPPGDTWETTDIWVDSPLNGYGTYRYGMWNDLSGNPVPTGNGDDPAIGQVNRIYARVRNVGTQAATDVEVTWQITDPPGLGIAGANGWVNIGAVDKNSFPGLANIAPGTYVDVYYQWTPDFAISPEDLAAGIFYFHTCVRVKLNHVAGETVFGNQDGDREQENISYFQAATDSVSPASFDRSITLRNDDLVNLKYFYLSYRDDIPAGWNLQVNNGIRGIQIPPGEVRQVPILIQPVGPAALGSIFGVDVLASSLRMLVNDLDPHDLHPEFEPLGGIRVEARVMDRITLTCTADSQGPGLVLVRGKLDSARFAEVRDQYTRVAVQGVDAGRRFLPGSLTVLVVNPDGTFQGYLNADTQGSAPMEAVCFFAGTIKLTGASSGFVAIPGITPEPTPTCNGLPATLVGTGAGETLIGTVGKDVIVALGGDDVILGRGGDDIICAGTGDDIAAGGPGRDWIDGEDGEDALTGADGDDLVYGGNGDDIIKGGRGRDILYGGYGDDMVNGGLGGDRIAGEAGDDLLDGGTGRDNDRLAGGDGNDVLAGRSGDDIIACGRGIADIGDGGPGTDTATGCEVLRGVP